jgi:hypothetical protein
MAGKDIIGIRPKGQIKGNASKEIRILPRNKKLMVVASSMNVAFERI